MLVLLTSTASQIKCDTVKQFYQGADCCTHSEHDIPNECSGAVTMGTTSTIPTNQDYDGMTAYIDTSVYFHNKMTPALLRRLKSIKDKPLSVTERCPYFWDAAKANKPNLDASVTSIIGWGQNPITQYMGYTLPTQKQFLDSMLSTESGTGVAFVKADGSCPGIEEGSAGWQQNAVNLLIEAEILKKWVNWPLSIPNGNFMPDTYATKNKNVFVPYGNQFSFIQLDMDEFSHATSEPQQIAGSYMAVNGHENSTDYILAKDSGRGQIEVVGNKIVKCGTWARDYKFENNGVGCATFDLDANGGISEWQAPSHFVKVSIRDLYPEWFPAEEGVSYVWLNDKTRDSIVDETHGYMMADFYIKKYNSTTGTQISSTDYQTLIRINLQTGEAVGSKPYWGVPDSVRELALNNSAAIDLTASDRPTRMALDDKGNVHLYIRQKGAETFFFVARFPIDFGHLALPTGRIHVPIHTPPNDAIMGAYWSMQYIQYYAGNLYFISGVRIYYVKYDYGWFTSEDLKYVPWRDEDAPLYNSDNHWDAGITAATNGKLYFSLGPHNFMRGSWDTERNMIPPGLAGGDTYSKGYFTRDTQTFLVVVDPVTHTIEDVRNLVTEDFAVCYKTWVDPTASYALSSCMTNEEASSTMPFDRGLYKFNKWDLKSTETAQYTSTQTETGFEAKRHTDVGDRMLIANASTLKMTGPGDLTYVDVNSIKHSVLHLKRDSKTTLVGSNLLNMGRQNRHPDLKGSEYKQNIVIGTDSGNVRGGMERSIIIGTNLANANPNVQGSLHDELFGEYDRLTSYGRHKPSQGVFAIGHDKPLISGNFDTETLNLPDLGSLDEVREKTATDDPLETGAIQIQSPRQNVLFTNRNIVQSINKGVEIDGVQSILDDINGLKKEVCLLKGGTEESCVFTPTIILFNVTEGKAWPSEVSWNLQKKSGNDWTNVVNRPLGDKDTLPIVKVFDFKYDGTVGSTRMLSGPLEAGEYRVVLKDDYGDGWDPQTGQPADATIQVGDRKVTLVQFSNQVDGNTDGQGCTHAGLPCQEEAIGYFTLPLPLIAANTTQT